MKLFRSMNVLALTMGMLLAAGVSARAQADEVVLTPVRDGTIGTQYDFVQDNLCSNAGAFLFAGQTFFAGPRRALLAFDIASNIPAGATVESVELTLNVSMVPNAGGAIDFGLHRLNADWGEGTSNSDGQSGGGGLTGATPNDVTWVYRFFPTDTWTADGGDFMAGASATLPIGLTLGDHTWPSTAALVADVQTWLDTPTDNHGWMLRAPNDDTMPGLPSARRFDSRENTNAATRPRLRVTFSTTTEGCTGDLGDANGDGAVNGADIQAFVDCALDLALPTLPCECADLDNDTVVGVGDIALFAQLLLS